MKILVTGASGIVGGAMVARLNQIKKYEVRTVGRSEKTPVLNNAEHVVARDLTSDLSLVEAVDSIDTIIHAAAQTHLLQESVTVPLTEFRLVNVAGTMNLAHHAVDAGVRRFIYISSIKVNGENTELGKPYTEDDAPAPIDPYGISKYEAEISLRQIAEETGLEVVIIRPVLVYGPGVKANFLSLMNWLNKGVPLPFGAIPNKRSLVALANLVDLIVTCIDHPASVNQVFLVSDGEDLSSTELFRRLSKAQGKPARLFPCPAKLLTFIAFLLGKKDVAQRLCGSLQVDISKARDLLGWEPPVSVGEGLRKVAEDFMKNKL